MNENRAKLILEDWFARESTWFAPDPDNDRRLKETFGGDLKHAREGALDAWTAHPETCLALVILLDQLSRSIHRGSADAFASDAKAQATVLVSIARKVDQKLTPRQRAFFYMPLMHAEDRAVQDRAVELFADLVDEAPPEDRARLESFHEYAVRHREIIQRFGRFPHRNALLGRASTPEERAFLEQPGSSF